MQEAEPPSPLVFNFAEEHLRASPYATLALKHNIRAGIQHERWVSDVLDEVEDHNPNLRDLLDDFIDGYALSCEEAVYFRRGFAVGYKVLSYSVGPGVKLPEVQRNVALDYLDWPALLGDDEEPYHQRIVNNLHEVDQEFAIFISECVTYDEKISEEEQEAFEVGAVLAFDALYQQAKENDIANDYWYRSHERPAAETAGDIASLIKRGFTDRT